MTAALPHDLGPMLNRLRTEAGLKQSEVAKQLKFDASKVSRMETGDFSPTIEELTSYLEIIGSSPALDYLDYLKQNWRILDRPAFTHSNREALWQAEQALQRLTDFINRPEMPRTLRGQAEYHERTLREAAAYLADVSHTVAYIGDMGVGKTSFLCAQIGLVLPDTDKGGRQLNMVLEVGGGGTTVCEVHVSQGPAYGIKVEPFEHSEIYRLATDFCEGLWTRARSTSSERPAGETPEGAEQEIGVSREVERALRNMARLNRLPVKGEDGKTRRVDPALKLAGDFDTLDAFRAEVLQKLGLWNRMKREIWFEEGSDVERLAKLKNTFTLINNGRHSDFSLPERMHIIVNQPILPATDLLLKVVDTKGVDKVAVRPDLQLFADNPRTITVLCSRFNSAPDTSLQGFIHHLREIGLDEAVKDRVVLLVLPRQEEAMAMKDDSGVPVETPDEGYLIKQEQAELALASLGANAIPIHFSNYQTDQPKEFSAALLAQIYKLRADQVQLIDTFSMAVDDLIANEAQAQAQAVLQEVTRRVLVFANGHKETPGKPGRVHQALLNAVQDANARSVWASTRRSGSWGNLNVYYYLGVGAAGIARRRTENAFVELTGVLNNLRDDAEFAHAHPFIDTLLLNIPKWRTSFLESVRHAGELSFRPALEDDSAFWRACAGYYGSGMRYRAHIVSKLGEWFDQEKNQPLHNAFEERIYNAWMQEVIEQLLGAVLQDTAVPAQVA